MRLFKKFHKDESGLAIVEATILLPVCILMIMAVYYASIFMCQKANIQANLQNALVYYKNTGSDTFIEANANMAYVRDENRLTTAGGSAYGTPSEKFPYRLILFSIDEDNFRSFFRSMAGVMFFDSGENIEITADSTNFVIYKSIKATATQTVRPAISFAMIGLPDAITIEVTGEVVVTDGDEFIRNIDLAVDLLSDTKLGEMAKNIGSKASELYSKFKTTFKLQ